MKKILFIHRGLQDYRIGLFNKLGKRLGITIMFTFTDNKKMYPHLFKRARFKSIIVKEKRPFLGYTEGFSLDLVRQLFKRKDDIIISSDLTSFATHASFLIAKLTGKKFLIWDELWEWPTSFSAKLAKPYAKLIAKHADACILAGSKAKEFYQNMGAKRNKLFIANNCAADMKPRVNKKHVEQLRRKYGLKNKRVILYLGRIIKYKGLDYLIRAFKKIEAKNPNTFLLIAGPDAGWESHCKKLAKELNITNIKFIGPAPHKEVSDYYSLSDVFVLPARFLYDDNVTNEAWGLAINETMSLSIPVVSTTAAAAAHDMITNGKNGYMVKERSVSQLTDAIQKTLRKSKQMGKNARKTFEQWNDYDKQYQGFENALNYVNKRTD